MSSGSFARSASGPEEGTCPHEATTAREALRLRARGIRPCPSFLSPAQATHVRAIAQECAELPSCQCRGSAASCVFHDGPETPDLPAAFSRPCRGILAVERHPLSLVALLNQYGRDRYFSFGRLSCGVAFAVEITPTERNESNGEGWSGTPGRGRVPLLDVGGGGSSGKPVRGRARSPPRVGVDPRECHEDRSSTSRTLRPSVASVNGFWRKGVPGSSTP